MSKHNMDVSSTVEHVAKVGNVELVRYVMGQHPDAKVFRHFALEVAEGLREVADKEESVDKTVALRVLADEVEALVRREAVVTLPDEVAADAPGDG